MAYTTSVTRKQMELFAELSGDRNPIHLNADVARHTSFGQPIVFGVQTALSVIEAGIKAVPTVFATHPTRIEAQLQQPTYCDETLDVKITQKAERRISLRVSVGETIVARLRIDLGGAIGVEPAPCKVAPFEYRQTPREREIDETLPIRGNIPLTVPWDPGLLFPNCQRLVGCRALVGLIRLSTIVGMEWPGRYSVLTDFEAVLNPDPSQKSLAYDVKNVDTRFSLTRITAASPDLSARITAFFRPPPVVQPSFEAIRSRINPTMPAHHKALVVGGSRGLGEVAVKLLAACGVTPTITYFNDAARATAVADEIRSGGGVCEVKHMDVRDRSEVAGFFEGAATFRSIFYFATPHIFHRRVDAFSAQLLRQFETYYVDAFHTLVMAAMAQGERPLGIFYPSTVAVDNPISDLMEYSIAKAAGEAMCRNLVQQFRGLEIIVKRLPRIHTDQTNTVGTAEIGDPVEVLLPAVTRLSGATVSSRS